MLENVESIPKDLEPVLRYTLGSGELLIILLSTDIRSDGNYGERWFALTDERILVFEPNIDPSGLGNFSLKQILLNVIHKKILLNI